MSAMLNPTENLGELDTQFLEKIVSFFKNNIATPTESYYISEMTNKLLSGFISECNARTISELEEFLTMYYPQMTRIEYRRILQEIECFDMGNDDSDQQFSSPKMYQALSVQTLYDTLGELGLENDTNPTSVYGFLQKSFAKS